MLSDVSVVELENVEDVWENADGSLGILFSTLILKTRSDLHRKYSKLFESRSGEMERNEAVYSLVGVLQLWEGQAYCYASNPWEVSASERRKEIEERTSSYLNGDKSFKRDIDSVIVGDELDDVVKLWIYNLEYSLERVYQKVKMENVLNVSTEEELGAYASKVTG